MDRSGRSSPNFSRRRCVTRGARLLSAWPASWAPRSRPTSLPGWPKPTDCSTSATTSPHRRSSRCWDCFRSGKRKTTILVRQRFGCRILQRYSGEPGAAFLRKMEVLLSRKRTSSPLGDRSLAPIGSHKAFWPPRRRCHSLHSNYMLNRGYAYTTIISSKYHGRTLLSHLASLYPHSTPQAWQQKLNNREVTVNGITAAGSESLTLGQTLVWNRPPWIEPDSPQHFEVLFEDPHLLAVNKPSGLPPLPGGGFMENPLLRLVQKQTPNANPVHRLGRATTGIVL